MITSTPSRRPRLESIDVLRGVVMIIMALDHTRDYLGASVGDPTNLATTTTALFFTRWITNFCAPVFFLLTGTGARLSLERKGRPGLSRYLLTRGLWLVFLEPIVVRCLVYQFNFDFHVTLLLILWALGWSMVVLSFLIRLPTWAIATFGLVMIAGHNALDVIRSANPFWLMLHGRGIAFTYTDHFVLVIYPLIPWAGVTAIGYALGAVYQWEPERRRTWLLRAGLATVAAFLVIRGINVYGDPAPWKVQATGLFTALSFINTSKYPASLLFLMMTLGPALLVLRAVDGRTPAILRPALTLGKVPLFYYLGHFFLIHVIATIVCFVRYGEIWYMFTSPDLANFPFTSPPNWGSALPMVWAWWVLVVVLMYWPSRWFAGVKARRGEWWWGYL